MTNKQPICKPMRAASRELPAGGLKPMKKLEDALEPAFRPDSLVVESWIQKFRGSENFVEAILSRCYFQLQSQVKLKTMTTLKPIYSPEQSNRTPTFTLVGLVREQTGLYPNDRDAPVTAESRSQRSCRYAL